MTKSQTTEAAGDGEEVESLRAKIKQLENRFSEDQEFEIEELNMKVRFKP